MASQLDSLRLALDQSPENIPLLSLFAQACIDEMLFEDALTSYEKVLKLDAENRESQLGFARCLYLLGRTSEAAVRVEAITQKLPDFAAAWILLARILIAEGTKGRAQEHYNRGISIEPSLKDLSIEKEFPKEEASTPEPEKISVGGVWEDEDEDEEDDEDEISLEQPSITFADIGGMEKVKEEIKMKIIYPLEHRDLFKSYGKKIGGGVLLYGPPGCGKTLISKATAGEIKATFISIGIHQILDMWLGNSEKNLHAIFETARQNAPAILFFDEVDALAADRRDLKKSAGRSLINQFLAEMDGSVEDNDGLLIIGATNAPWHIDPAFRRPGRFDRVLFVPPPDEPARESIIEIMAEGKPVSGLDAKAVARKTRDFSGADIKAIYDITIERCLASAMKQGKIVPIGTKDLIQSAKQLKPSTKEWFESARNYAIYSNQGGFYNDVLEFLGIRK